MGAQGVLFLADRAVRGLMRGARWQVFGDMSHTLSFCWRLTGVLVVTLLLCVAPAVQRAVRMVLRDNAADALRGPAAPNVFTFAYDPLDEGIVAMDAPCFHLGIYDDVASPPAKTTKLTAATPSQDTPTAAAAAAASIGDVELAGARPAAFCVFNFPAHHTPQLLDLSPLRQAPASTPIPTQRPWRPQPCHGRPGKIPCR